MFSLNERFEKKIDYERLHSYLPYRAWDPETGIYILDIGKQVRLGWFFVCIPISPRESFVQEFESLVSILPENSTLQLSICGMPFLQDILAGFLQLRNKTRLSKEFSDLDPSVRKILRTLMIGKVKNFIRMSKADTFTDQAYPYLYRNPVVYISFTIPSSEAKEAVRLKNRTEIMLRSMYLFPQTGTPLDLYNLLYFLFKKVTGVKIPSSIFLNKKKWLHYGIEYDIEEENSVEESSNREVDKINKNEADNVQAIIKNEVFEEFEGSEESESNISAGIDADMDNVDKKKNKKKKLPVSEQDIFVRLAEIITPPDIAFKVKSDCIETHDGRVLISFSYKNYPEEPALDVCDKLLGDPERPEAQLALNFFHTLNILIPDQTKEKEKLSRRHMVAAWQAFGPMAKFVPKMVKIKEELAYMLDKLTGQSVCKAYLHSIIVTDKNKADEVTGTFTTYAKRLGFYPVKDRFILLPLLLNSLPMSLSSDEVPKFFRARTLSSEMCAHFSPVYGDGGCIGKPILLFGTRRGFVFAGDIFASPTAYNGLIFGGTGGGKSFLLNEIISSYYSVGGKIIVVDVGRSFQKLCSVLKGEYIEFSEKSTININPFAHLSFNSEEDYREEVEMLKDFLEIMIAPKKGLTDYQKGVLTEIYIKTFEKYREETTFDVIAEELKAHPDRRIKDLGYMLLPWIKGGENYRWVAGGKSINFDSDLIVIELEELGGRPLLRSVALFYLIYRISFDFLQKSMKDAAFRKKPKFLFIDEAWELLKSGNMDFIERGYRRFRKTGSGIWIISQSPTDLEGTPITDAVWTNSQFVVSLRVESFDKKLVKKRMSEYAVNTLPGLRTVAGKFSEFYFKTPWGEECMRFYAPRFSQLVYTTNPAEVAKIEEYREQGLDYVQAINKVIEEDRKKRKK